MCREGREERALSHISVLGVMSATRPCLLCCLHRPVGVAVRSAVEGSASSHNGHVRRVTELQLQGDEQPPYHPLIAEFSSYNMRG